MTYSIVARDAETGDLGVAVATCSFATGSGVPWIEPKVGAIATQAFGDRSYGPLGLRLLAAGKSPEQVLAALVAADPAAALRQVGVVDAAGRSAAHTGSDCVADAGAWTAAGLSVQANMCRGAVWEPMADAFTSQTGTLARRLLAALEAAEAAGGDLRGRQSAALLVRPGDGRAWDRVSDLRVDDHPEPLAELRRLLRKEEAYRRLNRLPPDEAPDAAFDEARAAGIPEMELLVYDAVLAWKARRPDELERRLQPLIGAEPRWRGYLRALLEHPYDG